MQLFDLRWWDVVLVLAFSSSVGQVHAPTFITRNHDELYSLNHGIWPEVEVTGICTATTGPEEADGGSSQSAKAILMLTHVLNELCLPQVFSSLHCAIVGLLLPCSVAALITS